MRRIGPRKGTETKEGNLHCFLILDEKNRSPKGDGNGIRRFYCQTERMRRIGPRKGTETRKAYTLKVPAL